MTCDVQVTHFFWLPAHELFPMKVAANGGVR